ncbi:hypothetical protein [Actinomadura bangladeshensis]|uniref:Uncharacterized protein n=1 Tax=Actinomadura bangladeshensis TaxID=453573 RepID=A0A4R4N3W1_9ACTN|nr:hypothetical protein [Actinomadura bangladeshensis]TDC01467.1 hypothetical protein E1284_40145 [Actinomadura bangladeshensis]
MGFWARLLVWVVVFLVAVVGGGLGAMLFWSPAFVAWACVYVAIGVLAEAWLRQRERGQGWNVADRPVLQHPIEWSIVLVVIAALIGTGNAHLVSLAPGVGVLFVVIPYAWRERRRAGAQKRAEVAAGPSDDDERHAV